MSWRAIVKREIGRALLATRFAPRRFGGRGPLVVTFHRVSDDGVEDALTCSADLFDAFCALLARHFRVRTLSELVDDLGTGSCSPGDLAITFDDGYADNHLVAAEILERHGLSATFFVTTDFLGTTHVPEWDRGLRRPAPWMSWDQVRDLHARGFEIGAHTMTHVDLGVVDIETARREVVGSRDRVARELDGDPPRHFAIPFGGESNIRPEARAVIVEAGFSSCFSCYGGTNADLKSAFEIHRIPLPCGYRSPYEFVLDLLR